MIDIPSRMYNAFSSPVMKGIRGRSGFYPSSVSVELPNGEIEGSCLRQEYYRWFNAAPTEDFNPEFGAISMTGEALHAVITDFIRNHPIETELVLLRDEHSFFDEKNMLSGRIDLFLLDVKTDTLLGCDIKSLSDYAAGTCLAEPRLKDILQCAIYLDQYQKSAHSGNKPINEWAILYFARNDGLYKLKKYPHGSPFKSIWQFSLSFENDYIVSTDQFNNKTSYEWLTREVLYSRFKTLYKYIKAKQLPPRDFEYKYSEEKLAGMFKNGKIPTKKDRVTIEKWLDKGAPEGTLGIEMGDFGCRFCNFSSLCWSDKPEAFVKKSTDLYDLRNKSVIIPKDPIATVSTEPDDYI
jgi:hypothetical protein